MCNKKIKEALASEKECNFLYRGHADHHFPRRDGGNRSVHSGRLDHAVPEHGNVRHVCDGYERYLSTDNSADKADNTADSTDASADTSADSASTDSADTTDSGLKAIIPSVLDTDNGIRLGLDLVGGSRIVYEAEIPDGYDTSNLSDDMNSVQKVIRQRLTGKGFTEATYPSAATTA